LIRRHLFAVNPDNIRLGRHTDVIVNHRNIPPTAAF
jgi:hypothetical protein